MGKSIISKPPRSRRAIASGSGTTATNGGVIKIDLDKSFLTEEYSMDVAVSQTWGTNPPSSSDIRRMFSKFELVSSTFGTVYSCDFHQLVDQAKFTESSASPVVTLGAGGGAAATARFSVDCHAENDSSLLDLLTALQASEHGSLYMQLTISPDAANMFIGGSGAVGVAAVTVLVDAKEYRGYSGKNIRAGSFVFGKAKHVFKRMEEKSSASAAASNQEIMLETGGKLRFLFLHSYNTTGTIPTLANGIIDTISLDIGGVDYFKNCAAASLQQDNVGSRGFNQTGVTVLDFGDDPTGWPDMAGMTEVKLKYSTLGTAPAGWKVTCVQDFTVGLEKAIAR